MATMGHYSVYVALLQTAIEGPGFADALSLGLLLDSMMPNIPPEMVTPSPSNRSWGNEDLPGAHLDVSDPDAEKLDCFFAFLQDNLKLN